jgi:hypothetical protein
MQPLEANDPTVIGSYRLLRRLGAGGMGRVYLGRSPGGRTVAVKVVRSELADDAEFRTRFRREVDAARRVGGAWSAPVLDADTESPVPWIATGYVAGPALSEAVAEFGPLPDAGARALGAGLAETLAHVHGLGLIHRDLKPANVLLALDGPRLIDFGIARAMDATAASATGTGVVVGSPGYMSPEQVLARPIGPPSDIFALGAVLAYATTGRGPFRGDSAAVLLYKVAHEEPELDGMPAALREVAEACLAKDPAARPSPAEVARRLAPGGASVLVRQGWLPAALTGQLAARAVELLNLEAAAPQDAAPAGFGPAPSDYVPLAREREPWPEPEPEPGPGPGQEKPRRRRIAVAAAVVVTLAVAAGLAVRLLPRDGNSSGPVAATESATSTGTGTPASVPAAFVGRWKGDTTTSNLGAPGTMDITIKDGRVGAVVGRDHSVLDFLGTTYDCSGDWKLSKVTAKEIVLDTSGGTNPHPGICSDGSNNERFTLNSDGTLHYKSGDSLAGKPEGDLTKSGG